MGGQQAARGDSDAAANWWCCCCEQRKVSHDMGSRHAVTRPADGLPDATESHSERAGPVRELARQLTSLASRTPTVFRQDRVGRGRSKRKTTDAGADQPYSKLRQMKTCKHFPAAQYWERRVERNGSGLSTPLRNACSSAHRRAAARMRGHRSSCRGSRTVGRRDMAPWNMVWTMVQTTQRRPANEGCIQLPENGPTRAWDGCASARERARASKRRALGDTASCRPSTSTGTSTGSTTPRTKGRLRASAERKQPWGTGNNKEDAGAEGGVVEWACDIAAACVGN
jgi:hypothetical protein